MARGQAEPNIKNNRRQPPVPKGQGSRVKVNYSGFVLRVSELIICREASPGHQETANLSQKLTSTSNTTVSQAVPIQKQSYPGSAGTSPLQQATSPGAEKYVPSLLLLPCRSADLIEAPQRPQTLHKPSTPTRKRKRRQEEQEVGHPSSRTQEQPPSSCINKKESHQAPASDVIISPRILLGKCVRGGAWSTFRY
jgi:hypothetical protein